MPQSTHEPPIKSQTPPAVAGSAMPLQPPQESLAEAARKAREQKKVRQKAAKVFTNDNIPSFGRHRPGAQPADTARRRGTTATASASGNAPPGK